MKSTKILILSDVIIATFSADTVIENILTERHTDITGMIDGKKKSSQSINGNTVYSLTSGGTTYLPVRGIGEFMGKTVKWQGEPLILKDNTEVKDIVSIQDKGIRGNQDNS